MQFKNIVAFVSLAVMASALPAENIVARTNPSCSTGSQTVQCCDTVTEQLVNGIPVNVGVNCVNVNGEWLQYIQLLSNCG